MRTNSFVGQGGRAGGLGGLGGRVARNALACEVSRAVGSCGLVGRLGRLVRPAVLSGIWRKHERSRTNHSLRNGAALNLDEQGSRRHGAIRRTSQHFRDFQNPLPEHIPKLRISKITNREVWSIAFPVAQVPSLPRACMLVSIEFPFLLPLQCIRLWLRCDSPAFAHHHCYHYSCHSHD